MSTIQQENRQQPTEQRKTRSLWRNRDFLLLLSGQGVSSIGSQVSQLALPLLILTVTGSPVQTGIGTALRGLPYALFCLPAGALVDRWDRKRTMLICEIGRALALGSIPLAVLFGLLSMTQIYIVALLEGTLFTFFSMAETAALPNVVTKEQLPAATGYDQALYSGAIMLGPPLGGMLYGVSSMLPFLGDAISYTFSVVSLGFIKARFQQERAATKQKLWSEIKEGLVWLWRHNLLRLLALSTGGLVTASIGYELIIIVIAQSQHASALVIGLIFAAGGVGSLLGALLASPLMKRMGFSRLTISATWIWALTWLLFAVAPDPLSLGIINGVSYTIVPIYMVSQYSYRVTLIPDHLQGRVNSIFRLISFGGQPLGLALTGVLLQTIGPFWTVIALFVPQGIVAVVVTLDKHLWHAPPIEKL